MRSDRLAARYAERPFGGGASGAVSRDVSRGRVLPGARFRLGRVLPGGGFCLGSDFALGQVFAKQPHRRNGLTRQNGVRCAPMPEIGPWRTGGCAGCAQWGIGVRQFGGGAGGVAQGTSRGGGFAWGLFLPGVGFSPGAGCRRGRFFAWGQISPWGSFSPNSRTESMALRARTGFAVRRCPESAHGAPGDALGALSEGLVCGCLAAGHAERPFGGGARGGGTRDGVALGGGGTKGECAKGGGARWRVRVFAWGGRVCLGPVLVRGRFLTGGRFFAKQAHRKYGLTRHNGVRCAPMPEIGPWRTAEGTGCAQ